MQSTPQTQAFGNYQATWFTFVDQTGLPKIRVQLQVSNVDMTGWNTQGEIGYWMGIGFGAQNMTNADLVICELLFTGTTSGDQAFCTGYYSTGDGTPSLDTYDNIANNNTVTTYTTVNGVQRGTFQTTFDRVLSSSQPNDYSFYMKMTIDAIWAHG